MATARLQVALGITCVVVLLGGVVAALTVDESDAEVGTESSVAAAQSDAVEAGLTSSTVAAGETEPDPTGDVAPTDAGAPAGDAAPASTAPPPTSTPTGDQGAPGGPGHDDPVPATLGPVVPTKAGTYTYRTTTTSDGEETTEDLPSVYTDLSRGGGVVEQTLEARQAGNEAVSRIRWTGSSLLILETEFDFEGNQATCDWEPDHVQAVFPIEAGRTDKAASSCQVNVFGMDIDISRTTESRTIAVERISIAGTRVDAWRFEGTEKIVASSPTLNGSVTITSTSWFVPERGLIVRTEAEAQGTGILAEATGTSVAEVLNLDPT